MAIKGQAINVTITAIDSSTGKRKTGDSGNISIYLVKDGTAAARNDATAISETDATNCPGEYTVELDATDMNANTVVVTGKSSTANIEIVPVKIVTEVGKIADISGRIPDALVGGNLKVDVIAISGDAAAADNAELMFDGTGYAGGTTKLQTAVTSIATDAITAASIKADAVTKIQAGLSTHSAEDVKTAIEAAGSSIASILADTAELQTDWVNGGRLDLLIDAIKAKTDTYVVPPTTSEIKTALEIAGGTLALILADTGELQTDWVNGGRLDVLIDAIKAKTDTIPANPAQVGSAMTLTSAYDNAKQAWSTLTAQQVWEYGTRTLSSFGTLVADTAAAVWNSLTSALTTVGSIGKLLSQFVFTEAGKVDASATATVDESAIAAAVIAGLGGATVTITSPVSQSNDVTILRDTDYTTEIAWTYTYSGSLTGYTAALHCAGAGITSHTVTIAGSAGAYTLTAAFTNTETAALDTCIDDYSITFTKTADNTVLPYGVEGVMVVRDWAGT